MTGTGGLLRRIDLGQLEGCRRPGCSRPTFLPRRPNPLQVSTGSTELKIQEKTAFQVSTLDPTGRLLESHARSFLGLAEKYGAPLGSR